MEYQVDKLHSSHIFFNNVVQSIKDQYKKTYNIDCTGYDDVFKQYCVKYTYVMYQTNSIIGFFSISRIDMMNKGWFNKIVSILISILNRNVYIYDIYVFPEHRGTGKGVELVAKAMNICFCMWFVNSVRLQIYDKNLIKFYSKNGFNVIREFEKFDLLEYNPQKYIRKML